MKSNEALDRVIRKYSTYPEFLGLTISDPNQGGAVDDTLLHLTARIGAVEDMRILIDAGAEVNVKGDLGNTPLHGAAMKGQVEAVRLLIERGADPEIKNELGETARDVAAHLERKDVLKILK